PVSLKQPPQKGANNGLWRPQNDPRDHLGVSITPQLPTNSIKELADSDAAKLQPTRRPILHLDSRLTHQIPKQVRHMRPSFMMRNRKGNSVAVPPSTIPH